MNRLYILAAVVIALVATSCYKIINTSVPDEVVAGETFECSITVADDGDPYQKFVKDWSVAGVRVPEGWEVTAPTNSYKGYAEDWVYLENGAKADKSYPMKLNDRLTAFYNEACPKNGYKWVGLVSRVTVPKFNAACWRNGTDSISVTFKVTVPADCPAGTYTIDFIGGDEEAEEGIDKYATVADAKDSRLFHVGTFAHAYIKNSYPGFSRKVTVVADPSKVVSISDNAGDSDNLYTLDGKRLNKAAKKGVYIQNGKKTIVK